MKTAFGFRKVADGEKQGLVNEVFHSVANRYDLMNDVMSAGLHRVWKKALVTKLNPPKSANRPYRVLDMAGGTGDIAFRIVEASNKTATVTVADINASMLEVGRERAEKRGLSSLLTFEEVDAQALPYKDNSFHAYTIAFGIRNVPDIDKALCEAYRVLKPGGKFICLEFSHVDVPGLDTVYDAYSFYAIPKIGQWITKDSESYQYLVESIRTFPNAYRFEKMIEAAGFDRGRHTLYSGGIAALHIGVKL